jgi:signal transduction histidine kinase
MKRTWRSSGGLIVGMAFLVVGVAMVAYWDGRREGSTALREFASEQATLAKAIAAGIAGESIGDPALFARLKSIEHPELLLFLHRAGDPTLVGTDRTPLSSDRIVEAADAGEHSVRISREEARALGLPARTALAGIARVEGQGDRNWQVVAVASAERERDRETWALRRLVLSVLTATGLVVLFGGLSMRAQRKELVLKSELALESLRRTRDERLERANKAAVMGTLAMGVAHEISTPLGVIAARAEQIVARSPDDERLRNGAAAIVAQTDRIKQVIRSLLGMARGDAPVSERIDPEAVVAAAADLVEHRFNKQRTPLRRLCEPRLPPIVGDVRLLEQAVVNLLLNACNACRSGGEVIARARRTAEGVELVVEDSGTGMSLADVDRAKEPFLAPRVTGEGTGLGLAITREIVAGHRGTLEFGPREPRGTVATIHLPAAEGGAYG